MQRSTKNLYVTIRNWRYNPVLKTPSPAPWGNILGTHQPDLPPVCLWHWRLTLGADRMPALCAAGDPISCCSRTGLRKLLQIEALLVSPEFKQPRTLVAHALHQQGPGAQRCIGEVGCSSARVAMHARKVSIVLTRSENICHET